MLTCLELSSNPEGISYLVRVCLTGIGDKLCRTVDLKGQR